MDASTKQVKQREPSKVKVYNKFLISVDSQSTLTLEINKFNDNAFYFGFHKKSTEGGEEKNRRNSAYLPITLWKSFLNVVPFASFAIGVHIDH